MSLVLNTNASWNWWWTYSNHLLTYGQYPDFNQILLLLQLSGTRNLWRTNQSWAMNSSFSETKAPIDFAHSLIYGIPVNYIAQKFRDQTLYTWTSNWWNIWTSYLLCPWNSSYPFWMVMINQPWWDTNEIIKQTTIRIATLDTLSAWYIVWKRFEVEQYNALTCYMGRSNGNYSEAFNATCEMGMWFAWGLIHSDWTMSEIWTTSKSITKTITETTPARNSTQLIHLWDDNNGEYVDFIWTANWLTSQDWDIPYVDIIFKLRIKMNSRTWQAWPWIQWYNWFYHWYKWTSSTTSRPNPFQISME